MSVEFVLRLIGMVVLAIGGVYLGLGLSVAVGASAELWAAIFALLGALVGLVATPFLTPAPPAPFAATLCKCQPPPCWPL